MTVLSPRVNARSSEIHGWEAYSAAPRGDLAAFVVRYEGYREADSLPARRHMPGGVVPLIVEFGAPLRHIDRRYGDEPRTFDGFVAGLHESYALSESTGTSRGIQIDLTPLGARAMFGMPMHELTNRVIGLDDALGTDGRPFRERLCGTEDWDARFDIIDEAIAARLAAAPPPSEAIAWAWNRLSATGGRTSISHLTAELGWSRKHLVAQFREHVGLPPKTIARMIRFSRAVRKVSAATTVNWTAVALECGYYDQAHFIRDFTEFSGSSPSEFLARRLPGGAIGSD
jgi:AraC-like DNA-binding protein